MSASTTSISDLVVIGVNHRTCSDDLRQQIYVADEELAGVLSALQSAGAREAMVLSTCDRVEVAAVLQPETASDLVAHALSAPIGLTAAHLLPSLYRHEGVDAVRHLFRVASALDSQMIGEPQVLGQLKAAHRLARDHGASGLVLERVLQAGYEIAKTVRTDTRIGEGAVSLATAAVARIKDLHGDLSGRCGLLIGAGELGVLVAEHLLSAGADRVDVVDRFQRRAAVTAHELGGEFYGMEALGTRLTEADVLISALGEGHRLIETDLVEAVLKKRRRRPIFFLDLAIPGDIDPAVHRLDDAYVYDHDDLEYMIRETRAARETESRTAEAMVESAVTRFTRDDAGRDAGADIRKLRSHIHDLVARSVAEVGSGVRTGGGRTGTEVQDGAGSPDLDMLTHRIATRLAHAPSETLRRLAEDGRLDAANRALIEDVFGMGATDPEPDHSEED
jgi:glutamyl-tRNA reductase